MPRRSMMSASERDSLLALPDAKDELIRRYTFNDTELAVIGQHRGPANRLGFAVQLCYMRYPGVILGVEAELFAPVLRPVAAQLKVSPQIWADYGRSEQTRREHLIELQSVFGFRPSPPDTTAPTFMIWASWRCRPTRASCWPPRWWRVRAAAAFSCRR